MEDSASFDRRSDHFFLLLLSRSLGQSASFARLSCLLLFLLFVDRVVFFVEIVTCVGRINWRGSLFDRVWRCLIQLPLGGNLPIVGGELCSRKLTFFIFISVLSKKC